MAQMLEENKRWYAPYKNAINSLLQEATAAGVLSLDKSSSQPTNVLGNMKSMFHTNEFFRLEKLEQAGLCAAIAALLPAPEFLCEIEIDICGEKKPLVEKKEINTLTPFYSIRKGILFDNFKGEWNERKLNEALLAGIYQQDDIVAVTKQKVSTFYRCVHPFNFDPPSDEKGNWSRYGIDQKLLDPRALSVEENVRISNENVAKMAKKQVSRFEEWLPTIRSHHKANRLEILKKYMVDKLEWKNKKDGQRVESFADETQLTFLCEEQKLCFIAVNPDDIPYDIPGDKKTYFSRFTNRMNPAPTPGRDDNRISFKQQVKLEMWILLTKEKMTVLKLNKWRHRIFEDFLPPNINFQAIETILYHYLVIWKMDGFQAAAELDQDFKMQRAIKYENNKDTAMNYLNEVLYETAIRTTLLDTKIEQLISKEKRREIRLCHGCERMAVDPAVGLYHNRYTRWIEWKYVDDIHKYNTKNSLFEYSQGWFCYECIARLNKNAEEGPPFVAECMKCGLMKTFSSASDCHTAKWKGPNPLFYETPNKRFEVLCHIHNKCNNSNREQNSNNNNDVKEFQSKFKY
ncbi:MAG: hypothetical protein CBC48_10550 [bacterium TMED88]|nr:MAG: hypothetical protein CBC48_10550 [bacterium TMED88]